MTQVRQGIYVNDSNEERKNPAIHTVLTISTYIPAKSYRSIFKSATIVLGNVYVKSA